MRPLKPRRAATPKGRGSSRAARSAARFRCTSSSVAAAVAFAGATGCGGAPPEAVERRGHLCSANAQQAAGRVSPSSPACTEPTLAARVLAHGASISPDNPLQVVVRVSLSRPARVFVEYEHPLAGKFRSAVGAEAAEHEISLVRLRAETAYRYAIGAENEAAPLAGGANGSFTTDALPAAIDALRGRAEGRSTQPLLLTDLRLSRSAPPRSATTYLVRDETGEIVWYHKPSLRRTSAKFPLSFTTGAIAQLPHGNFLFLYRYCCFVEVTPLGEEVEAIADRTGVAHHDFLPQGDDRVLYISEEEFPVGTGDGGRDGGREVVASDLIRVLRRTDGSVRTVWDAREIWGLRTARWFGGRRSSTHLNSVAVGPKGNFVLSSRNRDQIVSLSADFRAVQWRLGGEDGDFEFPNPNDRFYGQHTAAELASGNVLVFDNGNGRPDAEGGEYSRAMELRLDHRAKTATKIWEHRAGQYAASAGSAYRLSNGNTLVNYGFEDLKLAHAKRAPIVLVEADPAGKEVFNIRHPKVRDAVFARYRAQALSSINGETMLRAPTARRGPDAALAQMAAREPDVYARFNLHVQSDGLFYVREPCSREDVEARFQLHVFPIDPADLPEERRGQGFESLDFHFDWRGAFFGGQCATHVALPAYPLARIRTGQYRVAREPLWQVALAADRAALATQLDAALDAVAGRPPAASGVFDVHLQGRQLIYFKAPCAAEEVAERFFLHVFPRDSADLPADRAGLNFDALGFDFHEHGALRVGRCTASVPLPNYAIARILTGQWIRDQGELWRVVVPADDASG